MQSALRGLGGEFLLARLDQGLGCIAQRLRFLPPFLDCLRYLKRTLGNFGGAWLWMV